MACRCGRKPCYSCYPQNMFKSRHSRHLNSSSLCPESTTYHKMNLHEFRSRKCMARLQSACHTFCHGLDFSISGDEVSSATPRSKASARRPPFGSNVMHAESDEILNTQSSIKLLTGALWCTTTIQKKSSTSWRVKITSFLFLKKKLLKFLGELVAFPWLSALLQLPVGDAL